MLQLKINELKETSNSRDVTQGSVSGGVTAASAMAAAVTIRSLKFSAAAPRRPRALPSAPSA